MQLVQTPSSRYVPTNVIMVHSMESNAREIVCSNLDIPEVLSRSSNSLLLLYMMLKAIFRRDENVEKNDHLV